MPLTDPPAEAIRHRIEAILATVETLGDDNTAQQMTVEPVDQFWNGAGDLVVSVEMTNDHWVNTAEEDAPAGQSLYRVEFLVACKIQTSRDGQPFDRRAAYVLASIRAAILSDATLNGLAYGPVNTGDGDVFATANNIAGVVVSFTIPYKTSLNNPFA